MSKMPVSNLNFKLFWQMTSLTHDIKVPKGLDLLLKLY